MKKYLHNIPMPIVGIMLSFAALGNLVQSYGDLYRNILGALSGVLLIITTIKFISNFEGLKNELNTPIGASVFPTYSMGIIILATYMKPYHHALAYATWIIGIILHVIVAITFTIKFVKNFNMKQVFPSWFIVYVGIAVAAVTGKAFNQTIGEYCFWFSFISYLVLLPMICKRVFIVKEIPEPAMPLLIIFAAPSSLCLAGYLNILDSKNLILFWFLLILSQGFYLFALVKLSGLLKLKFYPSYTAFTFPLVISALALKLSVNFMVTQNISVGILPIVVKVEELVAIVMVLYVFIRYIFHYSTTCKADKKISIHPSL